MLKTLSILLLACLAVILIGAGVVYFGVVNVAADRPHGSVVHWLLEVARNRSIAVRADDIEVPNLSDAALIQSGAGNYDAMCVGCHLAPGMESTELSRNLSPAPPNLTDPNRPHDAASDFWVIKHGIQASGMPAWGKSMSDSYIWGMVALLEQLPSLTAPEYRVLVANSEGHQHGGGETEATNHHSGGAGAAGHPHSGSDHHSAQPQAEPSPAPDVHHHADGSAHVH